MTVMPLLRRGRRSLLECWPWSVPVWVLAFIYLSHGRFLQRGVAALLALVVVLLASRRPDRSLLVLIIVLPFQGLVLAQLYAWGIPAAFVRPLSSWKETLALGVVVAGVQGYRASGRRLDRLDRLGLAYVAIVGAYALAPRLFAPGAPTDGSARSLAFRQIAGFVILLLAARHARLPSNFASRAANVVMIVGAVVAVIAVYEYFFSDAWNSFVVDNVKYIRYQLEILHTSPWSLTDVRRYGTVGGQQVVRVGSVFLDPLPAGFFLILPFAVAIERRLRGGLRSRAGMALVVVIGAALVLTQTRAALIAALIVVFLAVRHVEGRTLNRRFQFALIFAAALILALPAISATGLSQRVTTTTSGQDPSSIDHLDSFWKGVHAVGAEPLGHGVGTSAGIGQRFGSATITENSYLQVGIETGLIAMLVFAALTVAMVRRLRRSARHADLGTSAIRSAGFGLAVGAFLLHTWSELAVAWVFWVLAGAAIGIGDREVEAEEGVSSKRSALSTSTFAR
jgi:O-antigen ligase